MTLFQLHLDLRRGIWDSEMNQENLTAIEGHKVEPGEESRNRQQRHWQRHELRPVGSHREKPNQWVVVREGLLEEATLEVSRYTSGEEGGWRTFRLLRELPENWTDTRETLLEGMIFSLKYLGMTLVEQPKGEEMSAAAVKRIVATAKASGKKLQKVTLKVSPRGIILTDGITSQLIENVSIYRISYCTADKMHGKVFAYIAQSQHSENLECHAFLCTKRKVAQAVTLTVAQAFKVAFEFWQVSKEEKEKREKASQEGGDILGGGRCDSTSSLKNLVATGNLLDLEEKAPLSPVSANTTNVDEAPRAPALNNSSVVWELDDDLDEAFSRLAQSRTNPQVLDTGLTAQDIHYAQCLSPVDWDKADSSGAEQEDLFSF